MAERCSSPSIPDLYKSWAEDTEEDNIWDLPALQGFTARPGTLPHHVSMLCTTQRGEAAVCSHSGLQSADSSHLSTSSQYGPLTSLQPYSWAQCEPAAPAGCPTSTDQQVPAGLLNADLDAPSTAQSAHAASLAAGWFPPAAALYTSVSLNSTPEVPSLQRFVVQDKPHPTTSGRRRGRATSGSGVQQERRLQQLQHQHQQQLQVQQHVQLAGPPAPNTGAYSSSSLMSRPTQLQPPLLLPPSMLPYGAAVQSTALGLASYQQGLATGPLAPPPAALDAAGMPWQDSSRFWAGTQGSQGGPAAQYGGVPDSSSHGSSYCITYTPAAAPAAPSYACYSSGDMPYIGTQDFFAMPSGVGADLPGSEEDGGTDADISTGAARCSMRWGDRRKHKADGATDTAAPLDLPAVLPGWLGSMAPPQRQTPLDLSSCRTRVHKPQRSPKRSSLPASHPDLAPQPPSATSGGPLRLGLSHVSMNQPSKGSPLLLHVP